MPIPGEGCTVMPIAIVNRIKAPDKETFSHIIERFKNRAGLVDRMPGFQGFELWANEEKLEILVITRWRSREDLENWVNSQEFKKAHERAGTGGGSSESEGTVYDIIITTLDKRIN